MRLKFLIRNIRFDGEKKHEKLQKAQNFNDKLLYSKLSQNQPFLQICVIFYVIQISCLNLQANRTATIEQEYRRNILPKII